MSLQPNAILRHLKRRLPHGWVLPPVPFRVLLAIFSLTQLSHGNGWGRFPIGEGTVREEARAGGEVADGLWLDAVDVQTGLVGRRLDVQVEAADARVGLGAVGRVAVHVAAQVVVELGQAVGGEAVGRG